MTRERAEVGSRRPQNQNRAEPARTSPREWLAVAALLLVGFVLRTVALTQVPPGLHNDEVASIQMAESVAAGRLAVFLPENTGHEALYYYIAAPFARVFGPTLFAMRLPSVFLGMVSMCLVWALTRRLLGSVVAVVALAGCAVTFWTVGFGRVILRVVLEVPLAALSAYCLWRARSAERWRALMWCALSGVWLGLALNTYTAARVLPAALVAFALYVAFWQRSDRRRWLAGIAVALAVAALVATPLIVYLARHPSADESDFFEINRPLEELRGGNWEPAISATLKTFGMFAFVGDPLPYYDLPDRPVFEPVAALLLATGLLLAMGRWRQPEYAFILLWFLASLVPGMLSEPAPNYTRSIGVLVALFAFPGIAVAAILNAADVRLSGRRGARVRGVLHLLLALLLLGNLAWTVHDYFFAWPAEEVVRFWHQSDLKALADYLQTQADTSPVVVCVPDHLLDERDPWWKPAWQHMRYLLQRSDLALRYYNCTDTMVFASGPGRYAFPAAEDPAALAALPAWEILGPANLEQEFLPGGRGIVVRSGQGRYGDPVLAVLEQRMAQIAPGSTVQWAPEVVPEDRQAQVPVSLQGRVDLLGYTVGALPYKAGDQVDLVSYWRATGDLPPRLSQFTHILGSDGAIVTQQDRLGLTSASLRAGDVFVQAHRLTLPADLEAGEYALTIGLYSETDGVRMQVEQAGQPRGDRIWLRPIVVGR